MESEGIASTQISDPGPALMHRYVNNTCNWPSGDVLNAQRLSCFVPASTMYAELIHERLLMPKHPAPSRGIYARKPKQHCVESVMSKITCRMCLIVSAQHLPRWDAKQLFPIRRTAKLTGMA